MTHPIKTSIITVCYNNHDGLRLTLQSVWEQTEKNFELIVIDGGSTDGSREFIEQNAEKINYWVSEPDGGIYPAMNKGIAAANGEYCLFMNSGDKFHAADVLEKVTPLLCGKDYYVGDQQNVGAGNRFIRAPKSIKAGYLANRFLSHQAAFIRTALLKARPYDTNYRIISDWKQMMEELVLRNASYERLDMTVADFATDGISHDEKFSRVFNKEHEEILAELFPARIVPELTGYDPVDRKIRMALSKDDPWERDVKILRNLLKVLPRDLWRKIRGL